MILLGAEQATINGWVVVESRHNYEIPPIRGVAETRGSFGAVIRMHDLNSVYKVGFLPVQAYTLECHP